MIPIILALSVWLAFAVFGPVTRWGDLKGRNARNWPGWVVMSRRARDPAAVWAQEAYEAQRKVRRLWEVPFRLIGKLISRWDWIGRRMELMGHEVEVQAAARFYGADPARRRRREARALTGYRQFAGWTQPEILAAMHERSAVARKWVDDHATDIDQIKMERS